MKGSLFDSVKLLTRCSDGSSSIRSILQTRKKHDIDYWVVFIDLVKVFDTVHHKVLLKLLKKIGISKNIIQVIERLYNEFKIGIKVGKKKEMIEYTMGVKQGDNLAPIFFIIFMKFIAD